MNNKKGLEFSEIFSITTGAIGLISDIIALSTFISTLRLFSNTAS